MTSTYDRGWDTLFVKFLLFLSLTNTLLFTQLTLNITYYFTAVYSDAAGGYATLSPNAKWIENKVDRQIVLTISILSYHRLILELPPIGLIIGH
jgi:hypothetical protein